MEIRECLSVYLESGYLFDDMSGRLKWFEIDKILISFTYGVVRYVGTWGGCRTEKTLNIQERPALYAFKIATEYFRAHGMVPVFENSHCKLMRL